MSIATPWAVMSTCADWCSTRCWNLAACRTFIARAPEALLAQSGDEYFERLLAFYTSFCAAMRQKRFQPFGLSVATASALRPQRKSHWLRAAPCFHPLRHMARLTLKVQ